MKRAMKAYCATTTKAEFVRELEAHRKADSFIRKGTVFLHGKGSAVGCSLEVITRLRGLKVFLEDPAVYANFPEHLGIPAWLAMLAEQLYEGMSEKKSKSWPVDFARAIPVGADLEKVKIPFFIMLLEHSLASMKAREYDKAANPGIETAIAGSVAAVKRMIAAHRTGEGFAEAKKAATAAKKIAYQAMDTATGVEVECSRAAEAAWAKAKVLDQAARTAPSPAVEALAKAAWRAAKLAEANETKAWAARTAAGAANTAAETAETTMEKEAWGVATTMQLAGWTADATESAEWTAAHDYFAERLLALLRKCPVQR